MPLGYLYGKVITCGVSRPFQDLATLPTRTGGGGGEGGHAKERWDYAGAKQVPQTDTYYAVSIAWREDIVLHREDEKTAPL